MKRTTLIYSFAVTALTCLILVISCKKDNNGAVVIKGKLTGLVQKGPYTEASVSLYELNSSLERTGKAFNGQVLNKAGSFEIDNIALSSQYVELKANGYYFNEVSGDISPYHLSLSAISDIKDLTSVNINILTTLEKERVKYLVNDGYYFSDAKDIAQSEILSIFGFMFERNVISEKLDITVDNVINAKLLALSIIIQGNRNERELTKLLENISSDISRDGKLDNDTLLMSFRNATLKFDLKKIRDNLDNRYRQFGIAASIPDFESSIGDFFYFTGFPPFTETTDATSITPTSVILNGKVNCNDLGGACYFDYGTTTSYGNTTGPYIVDGHALKEISYNVNGLNPATLYHFRMKTEYTSGMVFGNDMTFTTLGKTPTVLTQLVTNVSTEGATLNGTVNANDLNTTISFEYGPTDSYGSTASSVPGELTGHANSNVYYLISGLSPGTLYHFRVKTVNLLGTVYGNDLTFTTLGKIPTVISSSVTNLTNDQVTLSGIVNANDLRTEVTFEYGTTDTYGNSVTTSQGLINGHTNTNVNCSISGLITGTNYHFRVKAVNSLGTVYSNDNIFKTLGDKPFASTMMASLIRASSATLKGLVNANYLTTVVSFEYGETISYGNMASAEQNSLNGGINNNVFAKVTGLNPETTYHFRIKADNALGTSYGNDISFTTPPAIINDVDGNSYTAVTIGNQVWMAENLRTTRFNDNVDIPLITDNSLWNRITFPGYCWYNNDSANKITYGGIYNGMSIYSTTNAGRNICPAGWHVPLIGEWVELVNFVGGESMAGQIVESGNNHWLTTTDATNETGFTALPGGFRESNGRFSGIGYFSYFPSASFFVNWSVTYSKWLFISFGTLLIPDNYYDANCGGSIRCIKDN